MHDVVVIGGGPAGSITAERLALGGHDVVLLEEHDRVGAPVHCTGLVGDDAFEEFHLPRHLVLGQAGAARFWGASGRPVTVRSDRVQAAVIDRAGLDQHLAGRARRAGADVRLGWRARQIAVDEHGVRVTGDTAGHAVSARAAVLACGASYVFHKRLGLGGPQVFLQSAQLEIPFPSADQVEVRFGRLVAPAGFAWLVPLRRDGQPYARVGLMSERHAAAHFRAFTAAVAAEGGLDAAALPAPRLKMLPLGPIRRTFADRVLAVGDAAGLVKPTTGGGIYYGLLSGVMAAEVLDGALRRDRLTATSLRAYEKSWRRRLGQEIRVGLAFRRIVARMSDEAIDAVVDLARIDGVVPILERTASFNWHRKAALALLAHPEFRRIALKSWQASSALF